MHVLPSGLVSAGTLTHQQLRTLTNSLPADSCRNLLQWLTQLSGSCQSALCSAPSFLLGGRLLQPVAAWIIPAQLHEMHIAA